MIKQPHFRKQTSLLFTLLLLLLYAILTLILFNYIISYTLSFNPAVLILLSVFLLYHRHNRCHSIANAEAVLPTG